MNPEDKLKSLVQNIERSLKEELRTDKLQKIATELADEVRIRSQLGFGVSKTGEERQKFQPLASRTIEKRKALKKEGKLSSLTTPSKSNLTETGDMLKGVTGKAVGDGKFRLDIKENRVDGKLNSDIANQVSKTRPFLNPSKNEIKRVLEKIVLNVKSKLDTIIK